MLKALIFDMDGVLVDSMPFHAAAWKRAFLEMGMEIRDEDIYAIEGSNPNTGLPLLIRCAGEDPEAFDFEEITAIYRQEFGKIFELKAFDGMKECLETLKSRYLLSVVSGSDRLIVNGILNQLFPGVFDAVVTGDDVIYAKPHPDPFLKAVELLQVRKEECLVIENAIFGVESAKRADIYCIGVPTYVDFEQLDRADLVVGGHRELMEHLLSLGSSPSI
ncbi:Beta-phosphoglucomutase [Methanosarcina sp. MTP4]|uniref:HAD family hydrolase n=1 Tax=Methanosarcina sp. MTP4 TaxID=1434100 RepID=UPI0006154DDC|nr:HAD family phosphatase [Methanosarcina sp. MTP4]AKB24144.1 Beta-phosphoglucomutase [Methanosarcina sp. MTP4]